MLAINGSFSDAGNPGSFIGGPLASSASTRLDSGSGWQRVVFSLSPGDLIAVSGRFGNDVPEALANVRELRLLNSASPNWTGLPIVAMLGIDNITVVLLPPAERLFGSGRIGLYKLRPRRRHSHKR